jgi:PAS domain S-box-containing protein
MRVFALAMFCGAIWALELFFEFLIPDPGIKILLARVRPLAHLGIFTGMALLGVEQAGAYPPFERKRYAALLVVPAITFLLSFGSDWHRLFRFHYRVAPYGPHIVAVSDKGPWNAALTGYEYLVIVIACVILVRAAITAQAEFRRTTLAMAFGWGSVVVLTALEELGGIAGQWGTTSYAVLAASAIMAWAVLRRRLLSLVPVARSTVLDQMSGLMFVLDSRRRLADCNSLAAAAMNVSPCACLGMGIDEIPTPWAKVVANAVESTDKRGRVLIGEREAAKAFEWSVSQLRDRGGRNIGAACLFIDITEGWRAEEALRESEGRFRRMADTAPVMIWLSGPDQLCTFFNRPWLDFTGRTMQEEIGDGWLSGVHPEDLERCLATYASAFDARRSFRIEYRLRRADGVYRWLLDSGTPRYHESEFTGFIGSCIDVTEQKMTEQQLRASEVRLLEAQRLAKAGNWELDLETGKIHWSDEVFRIYGRPNDAPLNFPALLGYIHPKDRTIILAAEQQMRSNSAPADLQYRIVRPNGEVRFVRGIMQAVTNDQHVPVRVVGFTQDITDQVQATERLRENEIRLRNAERLARVGNWRWEIRSDEVTFSDEMLRILGVAPSRAAGFDGFLEAVAPEDRERVSHWRNVCLAGKSGKSVEFQITRPNGEIRTVTCTSEVMLDDDGMPVRVNGTCQDVTDLRHAQEQALARQKLETVGTLAGGIAHDFNNLLGGVLAQAELALGSLAGGSPPKNELERIRDVAIRGAEIVRQLMIYAGEESDTVEPIDVSGAIADMRGLLTVSISKHAALEMDLEPRLPPVRANAALLQRILMNLVANASEAIGDRGGVIRVTSRHVMLEAPVAASKGLSRGEHVQVSVSDSGCGMSAETKARVFDPFFSTKSAGRGLGLAMVLGMVRTLGGAIDVRSEPGKGTTFEALLPCAESNAAATAPAVKADKEIEPPSHKASVLIVDDEDPLRQAVGKMLRKAGFEVLEAGDGSAAIELLRANETGSMRFCSI